MRRYEFKRNFAFELQVFGSIDHAHTALAELGKDVVVRDGSADHVA